MKKYLLLSTPKLLSIKKYFVILFIFANFIGFTQTITPTKTVTVNPNSCSLIDVELMIQGANPINRPLEVMLVIDVSGSMGYNIQGDTNTPIDYAKDAATDFINNIFLTANNPTGLNKVGIVSFGTTATLRQGLTLASGKNGLLSIINGLNANGSTNNQDGIVKADAELTANGTFNCVTARSIVLLTDGVTNRTGPTGSSCSSGTGGSCVQSTITAANNAKTTTVSGTVYNNQIFAIGLFGAISGSDQNTAEYTLNNVQSGGAFFTESAANLTGIYTQIFTQLSWVAAQITGTPFTTETISNDFTLVPGSISISKGTYSLAGNVISWNIDFLNVETIILRYQLTANANICGSQIVSSTRLDYKNSTCTNSSQNVITPPYCVPCPPIITKGSIASCYSSVSSAEAAAITATTATNNCSQSLTKTASTSGTCNAVITVTVTNSCGSSNSVTYNTKIDNTAPVIAALPATSTINCPATPVFAVATATDNCGADFTLTYNDVTTNGDCAGSYSITRTWTATDACGNFSTASQTINVQDITEPIFISELPDDISVSCDDIPSPEVVEASDNCDSEVDIIINDVINIEEGNCAGNYTILRTWTITDDCGNNNSYTQTITVYDNTAPTIITPIDEELNVNCSSVPEIPNLEFIDNCSGVANVSFTEETTTISIYEYVIVREWFVSDNCGNSDIFTQTINVNVEEPFDAIPYAICTQDEPINLFTILGNSIPTNGEWVDLSQTGGLNNNIFNPSNIPVGYYTLQYIVTTENNDCPMIFEVYLNINDDCIVLPACDITIYNAVSPNNDGLNDFFFIDGIDCYPNNTVEIYNKWGILIYETKGYDNNVRAFRGRSEGRSTLNKNEGVPDGTYYYILKYVDEENKSHDKAGYLYVSK